MKILGWFELNGDGDIKGIFYNEGFGIEVTPHPPTPDFWGKFPNSPIFFVECSP